MESAMTFYQIKNKEKHFQKDLLLSVFVVPGSASPVVSWLKVDVMETSETKELPKPTVLKSRFSPNVYPSPAITVTSWMKF